MVQEEFVLEDRDFRKLSKLVMDNAGIVLSERKRAFVHGRLGRRLRALGLNDFAQYCRLLETSDGDDELRNFINAVTTNHTSFFRESHHLDHLSRTILPGLMTENSDTRRIRIWSAGCSSGEEPYSIAMTLLSSTASLAGWNTKILATDLDTNVIAHAARGIYDTERAEGIPVALRNRFTSMRDGNVVMNDELCDLITFAHLNLLEAWPMQGPFDVIFCRNVVIYFDKPTQMRLFDRYANVLKPDGWLIIGHSENLIGITDRFEAVGRTIYRRIR
ncbi:protein-glutamate O-methyltransferase [Bradyrhizobium sp. 83012]|uniref:Chemotaxis protein methyltransferase n=1 Tax=Bradyrhizobium aeschynomenes TaxID=2734909 RepID=A0ABX2CLD6_9BRAD|nr:protein-glutamate O-methyltransferase [Bradyrhizobium aeschynomenes]NPU68991.1 protein-glutamate O-methyltransferase [Bradyrhizobium aeschynomenes]